MLLTCRLFLHERPENEEVQRLYDELCDTLHWYERQTNIPGKAEGPLATWGSGLPWWGVLRVPGTMACTVMPADPAAQQGQLRAANKTQVVQDGAPTAANGLIMKLKSCHSAADLIVLSALASGLLVVFLTQKIVRVMN